MHSHVTIIGHSLSHLPVLERCLRDTPVERVAVDEGDAIVHARALAVVVITRDAELALLDRVRAPMRAAFLTAHPMTSAPLTERAAQRADLVVRRSEDTPAHWHAVLEHSDAMQVVDGALEALGAQLPARLRDAIRGIAMHRERVTARALAAALRRSSRRVAGVVRSSCGYSAQAMVARFRIACAAQATRQQLESPALERLIGSSEALDKLRRRHTRHTG
jgi:hypothetical protein